MKIAISVFIALTSFSAFADEPANHDKINPSMAQFDERLPPVIPGEQISDGQDRMNVWSTSGGVTVNEAPRAPAPNRYDSERRNPVGVIVDTRRFPENDEDRRKNPKNNNIIINDSR